MISHDTELRVGNGDNTKRVMYLVKEFLLNTETMKIIGSTNSSGTAANAAELLKKLGYVTYENIRTETNTFEGRRQTRLIISIKKAKDFLKLYNENLENKAKKEQERQQQQHQPQQPQTNK